MPGVSSKTALLCLDRIGASDSAVAPNAVINVDDDAEDRVLPVENLIAIARNSGLQLRSASFDWHTLLAASTMKTVLVVLRNGNVVLVLGSGRDGIEEIAVSDPLYRNGDPFFLPRLNLEHAWGGEALVFKAATQQGGADARLVLIHPVRLRIVGGFAARFAGCRRWQAGGLQSPAPRDRGCRIFEPISGG